MYRKIVRNPPYRSTFEYYNVGVPGRPKNPAVFNILRGPLMRELVRRTAEHGAALYRIRAKRDEDNPKPHLQNWQAVRVTRMRIGAMESRESPLLGMPDRWMADVEAYAPHALAREFGRVIHRKGRAPDRWHKRYRFTTDENGKKLPINVTVRTRAEATLGGYRRKRQSVVADLERGGFL